MKLQKENKDQGPVQPELSEVWQELLGGRPIDSSAPATPDVAAVPTLESDPWRTLLQAKGVEIVDLQKFHLHMSAQDVEQMLQIMQERPAYNPSAGDSQATDNQ